MLRFGLALRIIKHELIVNLLLLFKITRLPKSISLTVFVAAVSWVLVEKPMLKFKHHCLWQVLLAVPLLEVKR